MNYLHRLLKDEVVRWLDRREILAIKGPRQSGKTTLLKMLQEYLTIEKKVPPQQVIYLTFEDREVLEKFSRNPKEYTRSFLLGHESEHFYFLIDEFQYLKESGQKLKLLYDLYENVKFIITGSSSLELTDATAKYLVGRIFSFHLFQFSFKESLETKPQNEFSFYQERSHWVAKWISTGEEIPKTDGLFEDTFQKYFEEFVLWGGYPEVIKTQRAEEKRMILKNIYDTYITKDIIGLLQLKDVSTYTTVVSLLANRMGSLMNYDDLISDSKSYFKQIKQYLSILEQTFILKLISPYFSNKTTELKKNPKLYFLDPGLRNYIINNFNEFSIRADVGNLVENFVLTQLLHKEVSSIRYWRTTGNAEVDFLIPLQAEQLLPIEVKYSTFEKCEIPRGFKNFCLSYSPPRALILTKGFWGKDSLGKTRVYFVPVWYI